MVDRPVISRPLAVFLTIVALLLLRAADARWSDQRLPSVIQRLVDADLEHRERQRALERVAGAVVFVVEPHDRLCAAMAALALEDTARFAQALKGGALPELVALSDAAGNQAQAIAALGDPLLEALMAAARSEANGDRAAAARQYGQVVQSSRLFHNATVGELAQSGVERTR